MHQLIEIVDIYTGLCCCLLSVIYVRGELNSEAISRETVEEKQPVHKSNLVLIQSRAELQSFDAFASMFALKIS